MIFSRPVVFPLPWSLWIMLIYTFINGSDWLCLKFDFWHLCRTAHLGYSVPVFSIAAGIYSFLPIHTAKVRLKTFILQVHKNNFFFHLPLADANLSHSYLLRALPWIHSSSLLLYSIPIWLLREEKYNMKIILKMVCFYWPGYIYL